ncbi:MAG TPA: AMP-binding protein [Candidatus Saccharimonadales bacterium]|nr:AMP-binding protein [Candidatus Saccharimonadales bacterium]
MKTFVDVIESFKNRDKDALVYKTGYRTFRLTYKELYQQVLLTVALLKELKLNKGDRILLWGFNSPEWSTVFLACSYSGIVIVPIDATSLPEFVGKIHKAVGAKMIFHSLYKLPPQLNIPQFTLEYLNEYLKTVKSNPNLKATINENDLLEIVYTSGTTADPKGVMLTHKNLITNSQAIIKAVKPSSDLTFLSVLPLSHLFEQNPGLLTPLSVGATIVYMRGLRPNLIFKTLSEEHITNIILVPRLLKLFTDGIKRELDEKGLTGIVENIQKIPATAGFKKFLFYPIHKKFGLDFQFFISGGAPLDEELKTFWRELGFVILEGYGLTESSPVLTVTGFENTKPNSVGKAVDGVKLQITQDNEICAKGANITQGYFNNPQATKALFEDGWMRTGDLGTVDKDGYLFLKGRKKDLIVTGAGVNVYPEDIEKLLLKHPEVKDVCVLGLPADDGEQVHAEVILKKKIDLRKLIEKVNSGLTDSQQITSYSIWEKEDFPRTTTLKIQKRFVLTEIQKRNETALTRKGNNLPKLYLTIAQITGVDAKNIKPTSKLALDLKLSSINRVELVSFLEQEYNIDIDEEEITRETTVSDLEKIIKERKRYETKSIFMPWLLSRPMRVIRYIYNVIVTDNLLRLFCKRTVVGLEHIKDLHEPVIFISNHIGYFDAPNILAALPFHIRDRIACAAHREYFIVPKHQIFKRLQYGFFYYYASIFTNIYLFPRERGFKKSLEYTGFLLDNKWNILFFPEGKHSPTGKMLPFKTGIGWLIKEMQVPVVPIKHQGLEKIMAGDHQTLPKRGNVTITFGKPFRPDITKSIPKITHELQEMITSM